MKKVSVINIGADEYHGYDHGCEVIGLGLPPGVDIDPGESAEVSEVKAEQLVADHPDWFKVGSGRKAKPAGADDAE